MSPGAALDRLRQEAADPIGAASRARSSGQKVVGVASAHVPRELVEAAGLFPAVLASDSRVETPRGDRYMEPFFDGPIRSLFDRTLTGRFDFADLIAIPRCGEGYLQLYYYLAEARRWGETGFPETYLFDLLNTPFWRTGRYVRSRIEDFRDRLAQLAGTPVTDDDIAAAIRATNAHHRLVLAVNALRRAVPSRLSGSDALRVFATAGWMKRIEHTALLETILGELQNTLPRLGVRVMVKGSPHDTTAFYDLVEGCGAVVVADDHPTGERMFAAFADEDIEPVEALTQKYQLRVPSIRSYPQSSQDAAFLDLAAAASVDAVIFYHEENDDTLGWDYPDQKRALDARGIPSVYLKKQSWRRPDVPTQRAAVQSLLEQVRAPRPEAAIV